MKRDVRFVICIIAVFMLVLLCLFMCTAEKEDDAKKAPVVTMTVTPVPTKVFSIPDDNDKTDNGENTRRLKIIEYYTITGSGSARIDTAENLVEENIIVTPELIVDFCLNSFTDEEIELEVSHIKTVDGICTIDFDDSIKAVAEEAGKTEDSILNALAQSVLDNCEEVDKVTFTINGGGYITANRTINLGEAYLSR